AAYADVPVKYLKHDVLADDFLQVLGNRIMDVGRPTCILGMHLCGRLSLQAIAAFQEIRLVRSLVLTPCCLPHVTQAPQELQGIYGCGLSDPEQFDLWVEA
ncbi:Phosphopyruvate hydratase, partial [Durusdinium trenchii]